MSVEDVVTNIDVLIISIPLHVMPSFRNVVDKAGDELIVVDASNYYLFRDNNM